MTDSITDGTRRTAAPGAGEPMIRLENLTKRYPDQPSPAVDDLSLDIARGETVVFVGRSGCGKTTTMKLINRIIEPTSGRIVLDGEDVTAVNPDRLRRRIGYAIQQVGLFPHMTVGDNIATVPRMLGWGRRGLADRVDELLTLIGLDPATYRDRYPKQLSGGQQQRVGVARALGADPPVMLMDEPFGAIDPITREGLQDEFLQLQRDIRKTVVFVTHDIDEAVKMGDRIAILGDGAQIAQYDSPERVLSDPADEFVASFVGAGASVRRLTLTRIGEVAVDPWPTLPAHGSQAETEAALRDAGRDFALLLDEGNRPAGWVPCVAEPPAGAGPASAGLPVLSPVGPRDTLFDALDRMLGHDSSLAVVVDGSGAYRGVLDIGTIRRLIHNKADALLDDTADAAVPHPSAPADTLSERRRGQR